MTEAAAKALDDEFEEIRWKVLLGNASTEDLEALIRDNPSLRLDRVTKELEKRKALKEFLSKPGTVDRPEIVVGNDYEGFFFRLVTKWVDELAKRGLKARHQKITITAGAWRASAVSLESDAKGSLTVDFYAAIRAGFGSLTGEEQEDIITKWL
jgi:hypothetical protein